MGSPTIDNSIGHDERDCVAFAVRRAGFEAVFPAQGAPGYSITRRGIGAAEMRSPPSVFA